MKNTLTHQAAFLLSLEDRLAKTGRSTKIGQLISDQISDYWKRWDFEARKKVIAEMSKLQSLYPINFDWETKWVEVPGVN